MYEAERDIAVEAALRAGDFIRMNVGRIHAQDIQEKSRHNLVTFVDDEAQRLIISILSESFPEYGFLAEEATENHDTIGTKNHARWIIDPLDGTTNFIHGVPPFAVSIGLEIDWKMVVGVVYDIMHNELFTATRGGGFFVNGVRKSVSKRTNLNDALITTGFPFKEFVFVDDYLAVMRNFMEKASGLRRTGASVIDLAYTAAGRFDGVFKMGYGAWDVAAGSLMVEEAGGKVTDFDGGENWLMGARLVASNGLIHDEMMPLIEPLRHL